MDILANNLKQQVLQERRANAELEFNRCTHFESKLDAQIAADKISTAMSELVVKGKQIASDSQLSESFRQKQLDELFATTTAAIDRAEKEGDTIMARAIAADEAITFPEAEENPVLAFLKAQEIRQSFKAKYTEAELWAKYEQDQNAGKYSELVHCLENDPMPGAWSFVTPSTRAHSRYCRNPEAFQKVISMRDTGATLKTYAQHMRALLK